MKESMKQRIIRCGVIFLITVTLLLVYGWLEEWKQDAFEAVNMVSERILVPGGQSVGIRMDVRGVLVVGLEEIETRRRFYIPPHSVPEQAAPENAVHLFFAKLQYLKLPLSH